MFPHREQASSCESLKQLGPNVYQILRTPYNDGYAKNVYNDKHYSNCHGQLSQLSIKRKVCTTFVNKTSDKKVITLYRQNIKIRP